MKYKKYASFILCALLMTAITVFLAPNAAFSTVVGVGALIGNDTVTNGTLGTSYSAWIAASGSAPISWKLELGSLPDGLKWAVENSQGGRINITGTPNMPGTFTFRFYVSNWVSAGYHYIGSTKDFTIVIQGPSKITTTSLPAGTEGVLYNQALSAHGPVLNWAVEPGAPLPDGLYLNSGGVIFGTPTKAGTFTFSIKTTNAWASDTKILTIVINSSGVAPGIVTSSLPGGTAGAAYSQALSATGTTPITWSLDSGSLPNGLSINGTTGVISGTPTTAGTFNFTIKATNSAGSDTKAFSITVYVASNSGSGSSSGGGGGCYAGFGALPMLALAFTAIMLRRKE
ncbi:MAG: Ig domain-containing protein [Synergistaceae bacterium]|nr:Ig domain-containing protein [Synergistaceae bacterium]